MITSPLSLDASALAADRHWFGMGAEARGVLASLWVAYATRGPIPDDPVFASRLALLDEKVVLAHWEEIAPFLAYAGGLIEIPALNAGMEARNRRSRAASIAARARHSKPANAQPTHSQRSKDIESQHDAPSLPGIPAALVPSPIPPTSLIGRESNSLSKEITTPGARVAPAVPVSDQPLIVSPEVATVPAKPTRTPREKVPSSTPPSYRDLFANPDHLEWFDKAVKLRSDHVERMPARLREVGGVAGHKPNPWAVQFLARVKSGYDPRLLVACLYLYLEHHEDVQRGYVQGLDVFFGNPASPKAKATFQAYLSGASAVLARSDAKREKQAAGVPQAAAAPALPSVPAALLQDAGFPIPGSDS